MKKYQVLGIAIALILLVVGGAYLLTHNTSLQSPLGLPFNKLLGSSSTSTPTASETINVSSYSGWDPTGKNDSSYAVQQAAAAANVYANDNGKHDRAVTLLFPCGTILVGGDSTHPGAIAPITESNVTLRTQTDGCLTVIGNRSWLNSLGQKTNGNGRGSFLSINGNNVSWKISSTTVEGFNFKWPVGGPAWHILSFADTSGITIKNNSSDYGNFETINTGSNVLVTNNHVTDAGRACFGMWGDLSNVQIVNNYCSTTAVVSTQNGHSVGLAFTAGDNSVPGGATVTHLYAANNTFYVNDEDSGGCVNLNGDRENGKSIDNVITNNKCYVSHNSTSIANSIDAFCFLNMAAGNGTTITNNLCDKGPFPIGTKPAIAIGSTSLNAVVENNVITNWVGNSKGVISVTSPGAMISGNTGTNVSSPFVGLTDETAHVSNNVVK